LTPTKKAAAMASSVMPLSRMAWKARNWSSGCSGARDVLDQRDLVDQDVAVGVADDAGHRRGLGQALLLHQQFERAIAAAAGGHLEHAGLAPSASRTGRTWRLWMRPRRAMDSASLDRDAGLDAPDVGLAQHQLVEGDVAPTTG
jgi:hypothetical protein